MALCRRVFWLPQFDLVIFRVIDPRELAIWLFHSLIVDPWGTVLADAGEGVGYVTAEIDLDQVAKARAAIPALQHDRDFYVPAGDEKVARAV